MKKLLAVFLLLSLILTAFVACTAKKDDTDTKDNGEKTTQTDDSKPDDKQNSDDKKDEKDKTLTAEQKKAAAVADCYRNAIQSKSASELARYTCGDDAENYYENVKNNYGGSSYSVEAEHAGTFQGYDVYYLTVADKQNADNKKSYFEFFSEQDGEVRLLLSADVVNEAVEACVCSSCGGAGGTMTGQIVCGICGGTGVQTIPNAYFDPTLNMWMPQTNACGGCGGSGHTSEGTFTPCAPCLGRGFLFS